MARIGRLNARSFRLEGLEDRCLMAAPVLDPIASVSVPANKSRIIPLTASDADGNPLTYSVTSSTGAITGRILKAGPDIKLSVAGYGDLIFQLLPEFAPKTVSTIVGLINQGFYNGLTFHRVVPNFVIQGGDPSGNGSGGPGFSFDDEFNPEAIFSGDGQLAMANSGKDTNGSQFFVTIGNQRFLDFNHTIWGQLIRGFDVLHAINNAPTSGSNNLPTTPIVITSAAIYNDTADSVLVLDASSSGSASVTVTVDDGTGNTATRSFTATAATDAVNDPPILGPVGNQVTATSTALSIPLSSVDLEGNAVTYAAADPSPNATFAINGNVLTVTPTAGYKGVVHMLVGVKQTGATSRGSTSNLYDTQAFTLTVKDQVLTPATTGSLSGTRGLATSGTVATFTAAVPYAASKFTATINWGDGATSSGTVSVQQDGSYAVSGSHTYSSAATFTLSTAITETLSNTSVSIGGSATIANPTVTGTFLGLTAPAGTGAVSGNIASFADTDLNSVASDFTSTITWGDGSNSSGVIAKVAAGSFTVNGTHTFAHSGSYNATVSFFRGGILAATATGTLSITLTPANRAPTLATIASQTIAEGSLLTVSATATDPDQGQTIAYSLAPGYPTGMTINATTGLISWIPTKGPASTNITVIATDSGTPAKNAQQTFAVTVIDVAPTVIVVPTAAISQFGTLATSGRFTDAGPGPWTATVDYGDGSGRTALALAADQTFVLNHTYGASGNFTVNIQVTDSGGATGQANLNVAVSVIPAVRVLASTRKVKKAIVGFDITADGGLDRATVTNPLNYAMIAPGKDKKFGTKDDVTTRFKSVSYSGNRVTLTTAKKLTPTGPLRLLVSGLRDSHGRSVASHLVSISKSGGLTVISGK